MRLIAKVPAVWYVRFVRGGANGKDTCCVVCSLCVCVCVWGGGGLMTSVPAVWSARFVRDGANDVGTCCAVCMLCEGWG